MTSIPFKSTFQQLQKVDLVAGRVFGNANHVHAQEMGGIDYAIGLGARIVFVTFAAVMVFLMVAFITTMNIPLFSGVALIGWAFALYFLAGAILPGDNALILPLIIELALFPMAVLDGYMRFPDLAFLDVFQALMPAFALIFGCLFAMYICSWLMYFVKKAFGVDEPEADYKARKAYRRAMRDFKRAHRNPEELAEYKRIGKWGFGALALWIGALSACLVLTFINPYFILAGFAAWFFGALPLIFVLSISERNTKKLLARLKAEGVLLPDPVSFGVVKKAPSELDRRLHLLFAKGGDHHVHVE
jgi:hypothetical protein